MLALESFFLITISFTSFKTYPVSLRCIRSLTQEKIQWQQHISPLPMNEDPQVSMNEYDSDRECSMFLLTHCFINVVCILRRQKYY